MKINYLAQNFELVSLTSGSYTDSDSDSELFEDDDVTGVELTENETCDLEVLGLGEFGVDMEFPTFSPFVRFVSLAQLNPHSGLISGNRKFGCSRFQCLCSFSICLVL